jgi:hypothetical protein
MLYEICPINLVSFTWIIVANMNANDRNTKKSSAVGYGTLGRSVRASSPRNVIVRTVVIPVKQNNPKSHSQPRIWSMSGLESEELGRLKGSRLVQFRYVKEIRTSLALWRFALRNFDHKNFYNDAYTLGLACHPNRNSTLSEIPAEQKGWSAEENVNKWRQHCPVHLSLYTDVHLLQDIPVLF